MPELMTKQDAIEALETFKNDYTRENSAICRAIDVAIDALKQAIKVEPARRGRWEKVGLFDHHRCTECGFVDTTEGRRVFPPYCSCCGMPMDAPLPEKEG